MTARLAPLAGLLLLLAASAPAAAQPADSLGLRYGAVEERQTNAQGYYFFVLPGEPTKQVSVWGSVRLPGVYVVSADADLSEVLSLAGGPLLPIIADRNERSVTIRVFNTAGTTRTLAYEASLEQMVREPGVHPTLRTGDVIEVETRDVRPWGFRDTFSLVGTLGSLTAVLLQVINLATR